MTPELRSARITQLAREIWEAEGRPDGHELRHWAMAERLVDAEIRAAEDDPPGQGASSASASTEVGAQPGASSDSKPNEPLT
ncbi:MAG TPA: DUF2934 domain-containing protein [Stenotrophomonas sp.]|jgi:hypothetical protein